MEKYTECPQCGNKVWHNKGISKKTNKPYENYKCSDCGWIEWVDREPPKYDRVNTSTSVLLNSINDIREKVDTIYAWVIKTKKEEEGSDDDSDYDDIPTIEDEEKNII